MLKKIGLSITRNLGKFAVTLVLSTTIIWAILEPFVTFIFNFDDVNKYYFVFLLLIPAFVVSVVKLYPKEKINIQLKNTNTKVEIVFGDIFKQKGVVAIGVNEYFDSKIGKPVSQESLHGYFISSIIGNKIEIFDETVKSELNDVPFKRIKRKLGKKKKFKIGTTIPLDFGNKKYLLFALSKTNENYEAYSSPSLLMKAINGLLVKARSECNGETLNLPLIGTGLSRSGIPSKNIIDLILIAILKSTKESEITKEIRIVLRHELFDIIDLNEIERKWK